MKERIIVFGLGRIFENVQQKIIQQFEVVACTDRNKIPCEVFWQRHYIKPGNILDYNFDRVLICSTRYYKEIQKNLLAMGVEQDKIYNLRCLISEDEEYENIITNWQRQRILCPNDNGYDKQVFVIGDSHTCFLGGDEVNSAVPLGDLIGINGCRDTMFPFKVFHTGPGLAYNAHKYGTCSATREKIDFLLKYSLIPKHSTILCCFGEIDIRVHVIKQAERKCAMIEAVLDDVIEHYLLFLHDLQKSNKVIVWGPIPSTKDGSYKDPLWPYYGSEQERNKATEYFNNRLEYGCRQNDIGYVSVFKHLVDKNYLTNSDYLSDGYHLSQQAWKYAKTEFETVGICVTPRKYL